ncbi:PIN domain-containing protein, partial [Candidatus Roizmanbacteria bacterium]|nr:PIN domain-containing protein [Candidatus Roizmanbacteria bacterium]
MVVDTSVLIRYFTNDDPIKAGKFEDFLRSKQPFTIPDVVFSEVYWTLLTFYQQPRERVITALESMFGFPSVTCNYQLISSTIAMVKKYRALSFVDAYIAAHSILRNDS